MGTRGNQGDVPDVERYDAGEEGYLAFVFSELRAAAAPHGGDDWSKPRAGGEPCP